MHLLHRMYEDTKNSRLEICCDRRTNDFTVYARHSEQGRGATVIRSNVKDARQVFRRLCDVAQREGWKDYIEKRVSRAFLGGPPKMEIVDGERVFRDPWSRDRIIDASSWHPPNVPIPPVVPAAEGSITVFVCRPVDLERDAFGLGDIPIPEDC